MSATLSPSLVSLPSAQGATLVRLTIADHVVDTTPDRAVARAGALAALHGRFPSFAYFAEGTEDGASPVNVAPAIEPSAPLASEPVYSGFGAGKQVTDESARARIVATYDRLEAAGVSGLARDKTVAGYTPGTRMAEIGYRNQEARRIEFLAQTPAREALAQLTATIRAEGREDVTVSAREMADAIRVNGKISAYGLELSEHAIRGLCTRIESPAIRYILGIRDRLSTGSPAEIQADKEKIADVLQHECRRAGDVALKLRTRKGPGDVFAVVSPTYAPADQPEVAGQLLPQLPADARASVSYDPGSTQWSLRLNVWTPTPVSEQAVGEPFQGYVQIGSRDNGTGSVDSSGGIIVLACLNAGTYQADGQSMSRRHVGRVLLDVSRMIRKARASIDALCSAWGTARESVIETPSDLKINDVIPGFWRHLLTDRRSELVGVLPGRTDTHVKDLSRTFETERRDQSRIVRADLAHSWTRYAQGFAPPVQREAEAAIGAWTVSGRVPTYHGES